MLSDFPWNLNSTCDSINIYANNVKCSVLVGQFNLDKDVTVLKEQMELRNTWIWSALSNFGILALIWAQTDRFSEFFKKSWI